MGKRSLILTVLLMGLIIAGCAGPSRLEMDYGTSFKLATFNQTLNPEAERNLEPVTGFDGEAAKITMDRYRKGFEAPSPPPTYVLGVGSMNK